MNRFVVYLLISMALMFFSCSDEVTNPQNSDDLSLSKGRKLNDPKVPVELTDAEEEGLIHARQAEKVARDVYTELYAAWGDKFLANLMASEQKHMNAVKRMLIKYGIDDPVTDDEVGVFSDPEFTKLFDDYVAQGLISQKEAMAVGVTIEEETIAFLEDQLSFVTAKSLKRVYTNLKRASERHLAAFVRHLPEIIF